MRTLYLPCAGHEHERQCRVFEVSNLVKSLILEVVDFPGLYDVDGREGRIIALLLDEVGRMPNAPYQVSMPSNPRLLRVCNAITADPPDPRHLDDWAVPAAMGRRHLTPSFQPETGMGLAVGRDGTEEGGS